MKVEILRENFKKGLAAVERVTGKNFSLPILDNVLVGTEDSFLYLSATDLETAVKVWILTKVVKQGQAVVPAKFLSNFIGSLPNEKISLESKGQNLHIECGSVKTQIQGHNPEEFPLLPKFNREEAIEVDNQVFCRGISQVVDMASSSQTRPEISGVYLLFSKSTIKMVATDSFRLAEKHIQLSNALQKEHAFILPQRPVREVMATLEGKEGVLKIYFANNQILFEFPTEDQKRPQVQIISRLIEGEYPRYQDIIPQKFKTESTLKRDELINQIKTAALFSGKINEVKLSFHPERGEVTVFAKSPELGENTSTLPGKVEGEEVSVSFNYRFLLDGLINIKSSEIVFEVSKEDGPCIIKPLGDASYLYVVMPIKSI